jgi:hypothetical protein
MLISNVPNSIRPSPNSTHSESNVLKNTTPVIDHPSNRTDSVSISDTAKMLSTNETIFNRTADEIDDMQKAGGFVNTMAYLSPKEKQLYNELVSSGNTLALQGLSLIAMSRVGSEDAEVTLPNGKSFNPNRTEITPDNIQNLFKLMFVDKTGDSQRSFDALASFLNKRENS